MKAKNPIVLTIGVIVVILLFILLHKYFNDHRRESKLYGSWEKVESEEGYNHMLTFAENGTYYTSYNEGEEGSEWSYQYIAPDSLIMFHHCFYEERYKILYHTEDTLIIRLSEYIIHLEDQGQEIEVDYIGDNHPIFTYIHLNAKQKKRQ